MSVAALFMLAVIAQAEEDKAKKLSLDQAPKVWPSTHQGTSASPINPKPLPNAVSSFWLAPKSAPASPPPHGRW